MELEAKLDLIDVTFSTNLCDQLSDHDLDEIGRAVVAEYTLDKRSRVEWEERTEDAMKLALQVTEEKSFPWPGASNIKFPLVTISALQFHTRAYPALISGSNIVTCKTYGPDPKGEKAKRADAISQHMSYQILEQDTSWEDQMDRTLITLPILGCAFKKTYFDPVKKHNVSINIFAKDLVVDYYTRSLEEANRITHVIELDSNAIYERSVMGIFRDIDYSPRRPDTDRLNQLKNEIQGVHEDANSDVDAPQIFLEQHRFLDLDGDGYKEPYIVTVHKETSQVVRVVARFRQQSIQYANEVTQEILRIIPDHYFTKYSFIPSPDGGFYDLGFGVLLGPLNESINTIINQLTDAGTMATTGGGFLGRGLKIRGGDYSFKPNEWKRTDSTGDDLRKNIFPLPVREPSQVLFSLLNYLVSYGERIAGATETMTGVSPGQNTPAETSRNTLAEGLRIFKGIFKRVYRSLKEEYQKLYKLNGLFLDEMGPNPFGVPQDIYQTPNEVTPSADPDVVTDEQRQYQAMMLKQMSTSTPGWDIYEVDKEWLTAFKIKNGEKLRPDPKGPNAIQPQPNPKVQVEQIKQQTKQSEIQLKAKELEFDMQIQMFELMQEAKMNQAKIMELEAKAFLAIEQAGGIKTGHEIALMEAQIGAAKLKQDSMVQQIETMRKVLETVNKGREIDNAIKTGDEGGMGSMAGQPSNQGGQRTSPQGQAR